MCVLMCRTIGGRIIYQRTAARGVCTRPMGNGGNRVPDSIAGPLLCAGAPRNAIDPPAGVRRNTFLPRRFVAAAAAASVLHPFICMCMFGGGGGLSGRESTPAVAIGRQGRVDRYRPGLSPRPPAVVATVFSFAAVRRVGGFPADFRRHLARHEKNGARARPANRSRALRVTVTGRTAAVPDRKCPFANAVRERAAVYTRYLSSTPFIVTYTHTYT